MSTVQEEVSLFRTMSKESPKERRHSLSDMSTVQEEDEDSMAAVLQSMEKATTEEGGDNDDNDNKIDDQEQDDGDMEEEEDDEDLADLMSVRETMQSLLIDDSEDENKKSPIKFSLSSDRESRGDPNDGDDDMTDQKSDDVDGGDDDDDENNTDNDDGDNEGSDDNEEDQENEDDDEDNNGEGKDMTDDAGINRSTSVDNENPQTPDENRDVIADLFPTDDDSDSEFQDGEDGDFDLFGRLEESRAQLEEELGAEKLIQVYKTVQALQEDEDENIEEGARIATELLGKDKEHLYPKIFQLVMADAAFTDDNLS